MVQWHIQVAGYVGVAGSKLPVVCLARQSLVQSGHGVEGFYRPSGSALNFLDNFKPSYKKLDLRNKL